ncbi:MAG: serine/threonine-protein phosphatase [Prevotella sp.]|nr:serine/threonine-protein phosphatase [Prevotella sp.]
MELQKIYSDEKGLVTAFAESRIGGRPENQDSYGWQETSFGYLVTVCDGMGGGPGGKTASTIAVKEIVEGISEANKDEDVSNIIIKAIRRANMAIIETGNNNEALRGMGSTATVLLVSEKSAHIAHVGDSRVYQLRGSKKVFRTFDHSMVFEMVAQGVITEEQARLSAQSNVITRALGVKPDVEVEIHEVAYEKGDKFLLCSDGIHGAMPEKDLIKMIAKSNGKLGVITDDIATFVDNLGRTSGGGHDNLTIAIVETKNNSKLKQKMSKQTRFLVMGLIALAVISILFNLIQLGSSSKGEPAVNDSIITLNDSIAKQAVCIQDYKKSLDDINDQVNQISGSNLSPVDSIRRIINKNKK